MFVSPNVFLHFLGVLGVLAVCPRFALANRSDAGGMILPWRSWRLGGSSGIKQPHTRGSGGISLLGVLGVLAVNPHAGSLRQRRAIPGLAGCSSRIRGRVRLVRGAIACQWL